MVSDFAFGLAMLASSLAALYAVRAGWVSFEFGLLLLLTSLVAILLGLHLADERTQDVDIGGDERW